MTAIQELKKTLLEIGIVLDNEYLDLYISLINQNLTTKQEIHKTQRHHIIPKYYYKENGLKINNKVENIVNLFFKDHVLAHYYLALCSTKNYYKFSNVFAIKHLLGAKYIKGMPIESSLLKFTGSLQYYQQLYEEGTKHFYDIYHKGKKCSEENKIKSSKRMMNHVWTDEEIKRRVVTRRKNGNWKYSPELIKKLSDSHKGQIAWNKGLKMSKSFSEKVREGKIGKKQSEKHIKARSIGLLGHKVSDTTKQKIAESNKIFVDEEIKSNIILDYTKNNLSPSQLSKKYNFTTWLCRRLLKEANVYLGTGKKYK